MADTDDWFEVDRINDDTWRIGEAAVFNDYLFVGDERALVLDGSVGVGDLRTVVDDLVDVPVEMIPTHTHWDHIGCAHQFEDVRVHPIERTPDGGIDPYYVAEEFNFGPEDWLREFPAAGGEFPDGFDHEAFEIAPVDTVGTVEGGDVIDLGGRELELFHLPGHCPGQLGALDRGRGDLYAGDVLHLEHDLFLHFDGCDLEDNVASYGRIRDMKAEGVFDTLYTAHNRPLEGEDLSLIDEYHEAQQAILADELDWEHNDEHPPGRVYTVAGNEIITKPDVT